MYISLSQLEKNLEADINKIVEAAINSADPYKSVFDSIFIDKNELIICGERYAVDAFENIYLIGTGKAVIPMAAATLKKCGDLIHSGIIITKHAMSKWQLPKRIEVLKGGHPVPSEKSISSTKKLVSFLETISEKDLVINLISGGGSALMTKPHGNTTLEDFQEMTTVLLNCGATIQEINTIRKHVDQVKGGGIARIVGNTTILSLIISDVLGDDVSMIASGPTCPDETTFKDAMRIITKYNLGNKMPKQIFDHIKKGISKKLEETLKPSDPININKYHHIIASLKESITAAANKALELGYKVQIDSINIIGEARDIGKYYGKKLKSMSNKDFTFLKPAILIGGGETTVTMLGSGMGGRNQEIAFGAMKFISGCKKCVLVTLATDGEDGPTDAAGAYVTGKTYNRALRKSLDTLAYGNNNDTYSFFKELDNLVISGPTGTNVNDLIFLIAY